MTTSKKKTTRAKKSAKGAARKNKKNASKKVGATSPALALKITPQGPNPELFATLSRELFEHAYLRPFTAKTRSRLLALELVEEEPETKSTRPPALSGSLSRDDLRLHQQSNDHSRGQPQQQTETGYIRIQPPAFSH